MTEQEIRDELEYIDCALSPENLHCDGEISHAEAMRKYRKLTARQNALLKMLNK